MASLSSRISPDLQKLEPQHFFDEPHLDEVYKLNNNQKFHLNRVFIEVFRKQIISFLVATAIASMFLISSLAWTGMIQALGILIIGSYFNYYYSKDQVFKGYLRGEVAMEHATVFVNYINLSINMVIAGLLLALGLDYFAFGWLGLTIAGVIWVYCIWRFVSIFLKLKNIEENIQHIAPWA